MSKRERKFDLVIKLLESEADKLNQEIKDECGALKEKIELKCQIMDTIKNIKLMDEHKLFADNIKLIEIPEGGSESYFTEFNIVDYNHINKVHDSALKKDKNGNIITLSCFDFVLKRQ